MQVHLKTLGCRLNEAELEAWSRGFRSLGHRITPRMSEADLVVINTCAVTGEAVRKSRKLMHRAHRDNPKARLVVSGCFADLDPDETAQSMGVDLVVANKDKDRLVEIAEQALDLNAMPERATLPAALDSLASGRQRAFVKIQDGCRYQCTFCVVTLARGTERSRSPGEIIEEINRLYQQGAREVVLTGVHLGGYGSGLGLDLAQLVSKILAETDIPRLRLGAVEPWDLSDQFWLLFDDARCMPHLHLPLQSGADSVLRRMARRCKADQFRTLVEQARRQIPDFNVTSDIIVGFPGETHGEWQKTMELSREIGFGHLHIFAYSSRPGTRAATLPEQLPHSLIRARSRELHELAEIMKRETLQRYLGRRLPVLIEGKSSTDRCRWGGYTPNFLRVSLDCSGDQPLENTIRLVEMDAISTTGGELTGHLVDDNG